MKARCPNCGRSPAARQRCACGDCGQRFDPFETHGRCPHCRRSYLYVRCGFCRQKALHEEYCEELLELECPPGVSSCTARPSSVERSNRGLVSSRVAPAPKPRPRITPTVAPRPLPVRSSPCVAPVHIRDGRTGRVLVTVPGHLAANADPWIWSEARQLASFRSGATARSAPRSKTPTSGSVENWLGAALIGVGVVAVTLVVRIGAVLLVAGAAAKVKA